MKKGDKVRILNGSYGHSAGDIGEVIEIKPDGIVVNVSGKISSSVYKPNVIYLEHYLQKIPDNMFFPSETTPGKFYTVKTGKDGVIYCDCWQWKKTRDCEHLQVFKGEKLKEKPRDTLQEVLKSVIEELRTP